MESIRVDVRPLAESELEIVDAELPRNTPETHRDRYKEQRRGETTYLVAWAGDEPVGHAQIKWKTTKAMTDAYPETPIVGDVAVRPDICSRGIGTQLMDEVEALVRSKGCSRLALGVGVDNVLAADFYRRRGYFSADVEPSRAGGLLLDQQESWYGGGMCNFLSKQLDDAGIVRVIGRAKINVALEVGELRPDGRHEVHSVLQSVALADELIARKAWTPGSFVIWAAGLNGDLPGSPNLVDAASRLFYERAGRRRRVVMRVIKSIPIGAGLGGGSADAAAALLAINEINDVALEADEVAGIASELGADVPFCLTGGTARAEGAGDVLTTVEVPGRMWWVLGIPDVELATADVYRKFDSLRSPPDHDTDRIDRLIKALKSADISAVAAGMRNDLEFAALELAPSLRGLKEAMLKAGAVGSVMTGSGSTVLGLCTGQDHAVAVAKKALPAFSRVEITVSRRRGAEVVRS